MRAKRIAIVLSAATAAMLAGCTAMTAGQLVQAGYDAAKTSLAGAPAGQTGAPHVKSVMNSIDVGQETAPIIASMGEPPKEKSGNPQGYTCYEYAAVYSPTEDAVIVSKDGKVMFFGNSTCHAEMQDANFKRGGKYAAGAGTDTDGAGNNAAGTDSNAAGTGNNAGANAGGAPDAGADSDASTGSAAGPDTTTDTSAGVGPGAASGSTEAGPDQGASPASAQAPVSK